MPLQKQELIVPLGVGMNESVPRELLPNDQLHDVQNARVRKPGQLEKRYGYELLAGGNAAALDSFSVTSPCHRLLRRDTELCMIDDTYQLLSYSDAAQKWKANSKSIVPEAQFTNQRVVGQIYHDGTVKNTATAQIGDYVCVAWDTFASSPQATIKIYDVVTETTITQFTVSGVQAAEIAVIATGTYFVIAYRTDSLPPYEIEAYSFNTSTQTLSAATVITNTAATDNGGEFDIYPNGSGNFVLLNLSGTGTLDLYSFSASAFALLDSELDIRAGKTVGSPVLYVSGVIYCAFVNATDTTVEVKGHDASTLAQTFAAQVVYTPGASYSLPANLAVGQKDNSNSQAWVMWDRTPVAGSTTLQAGFGYRQVTSAGSVHATTYNQYNYKLFSRPFRCNDRSYIFALSALGHPNTTYGTLQSEQSALCILDLGDASDATGTFVTRPVARFNEGEIGAFYSTLPDVPVSVAGAALVPFVMFDPSYVWTPGAPGTAPAMTTIGVAKFQFPLSQQTSTHWAGCSEIDTTALIPGGLLHHYDGNSVREFWVYYPWIDQITVTATAGTLTVGTQYDYCVVYVVQDHQGRMWRSRPSIIRSATPTAGNQTIRLRIPYYSATQQYLNSGFDTVGIEIYRRAAASDPFVRLSNSGVTVIANSPFAASFLEVSDTGFSITDQPNLYTNGGVLEAFTPPPCAQTIIYDNRVWIYFRNQLWYTREIVDGEGPAFHPAQAIVIGDEADITGMAVMDSNLIIFKAESIFFIQGIGPDDTGANPSYSVPQRVMTAVGCVNLKSIVTGYKGVYFQSRRGIERLNRDMSQEYVGDRVEDSFSGNYDVTAAVQVQRDNEIRFSVTADDPNVSCLVYDELHDLWTKDIFHGGSGTQATSAVSVGGHYYWLEKSDYQVYKETVDAYSDEAWDGDSIADTWIKLQIETGDIARPTSQAWSASPVSEIEWWRTMLFGRRAGSHDLSIEIALSQSDSWQTAKTWTASDISSWMGVPIELAEALPTGQRGRSIRFRIHDDTDFDVAPTKGPVLYALGIEYGVEGGLTRVPAAQRK